MSTSQSNTNRIAKNTVVLYVRSLIVLLISLYTSRVILQALGVVDFGIYNVVGGVISALSFLNWSLQGTYQRFFNVEMARGGTESISRQFKVANSIQLLMALIIVVLAETVGLWFVNTHLVIPADRMIAANWVYQVTIVSAVISVICSPFGALITAYERMDLFAFISIISALLRLVIVFIVKYTMYDKLVTYSVLLLSVSFIDWTLYFFLTKRPFPESSIKLMWDRKLMKSMTSFGGWVIVDSLSQMLKGQGINIVLNLFFGPVVNSARGIAYQVMNAINQFISSFQTSFRPQLTKSYAEGDYQYMRRLYYSSSKLSYYLLFVLSLPILLETEHILHLWLGENVPEYTASFTRIVLITTFLSAFANPTSCIAYATGSIKRFTIVVSSIMLSIVPISYVFLRFGGSPNVALWVSFFVSIIAQVARMFLLNRLVDVDIKEYLKRVILPILGCTLIITAISFLPRFFFSTSFVRLAASAFTSVIVSIIIIWLIGLDVDERSLIKNKITSFFRRKKVCS